MINFDKVCEIRNMYYNEQTSIAEIVDKTGISINTVKKYLDMSDFNKGPPDMKEDVICPKLDPWKPLIDSWLEKDKTALRKQRHTALRVFERLKDADPLFNCSYRTVCSYVSYRREALGEGKITAKVPLVHLPGECQGDFGEVMFVENGIEKTGKFFVLDFPYSNSAFAQIKYGENMECLLESLDAIFRYIGGVPPAIWFDNASTMVTEVMRGGGRKLTERFMRFLEHYRIQAIFMNPGQGNEKGGVESKVGYIRRHMLVPVPEFENLDVYNQHFFQLQEDDLLRCHYRKSRFISDLFLDDLRELIPLPSEQFDLADHRTFKTDPTGLFTVDRKYTYSSSPQLERKRIHVRFTSKEVIVLDPYGKEVIKHERLYGRNPQMSIDWIPYLKAIANKPRSLFNTGFAALLPEEMRLFLYQCDNTERGRILRIIADVSEQYGFQEALNLIGKAVQTHAADADNFEALYRRLYIHVPSFSAPHLPEQTFQMPSLKPDLSLYNRLLDNGKDKDNG